MSQSAVQPGLSTVLSGLAQHSTEGSELYLMSFSELEGRTFREARRRFDKATVRGRREGGGKGGACEGEI
jgi:hypothetical protein